jgi:hypothetical protein
MLQQFLHDFGYFALFLGTFFEGETILVLAGFLAFRGYMDINLVVVVAFFGSYAGDQLWYFMGRKHGRKCSRASRAGNDGRPGAGTYPQASGHLGAEFPLRLRPAHGDAGGHRPVRLSAGPLPAAQRHRRRGLGHGPGAAAYHFGAVLEGMLGSIKKYELWVLGALLVLGLACGCADASRMRAWPSRFAPMSKP